MANNMNTSKREFLENSTLSDHDQKDGSGVFVKVRKESLALLSIEDGFPNPILVVVTFAILDRIMRIQSKNKTNMRYHEPSLGSAYPTFLNIKFECQVLSTKEAERTLGFVTVEENRQQFPTLKALRETTEISVVEEGSCRSECFRIKS
ncbi:hypothetical protein LOAG_08532 [Loa loa]|uniref:Uncharacterized protein n=1 Tax=Loa loa TaxID=7209 RepID=A0A1S0TTH1_LOALO|nr:hypothetical protein LOAG_08532 [Loa loa]EFO19958.1 hypothetical protein LOAG_08532 [Loa loa]